MFTLWPWLMHWCSCVQYPIYVTHYQCNSTTFSLTGFLKLLNIKPACVKLFYTTVGSDQRNLIGRDAFYECSYQCITAFGHFKSAVSLHFTGISKNGLWPCAYDRITAVILEYICTPSWMLLLHSHWWVKMEAIITLAVYCLWNDIIRSLTLLCYYGCIGILSYKTCYWLLRFTWRPSPVWGFCIVTDSQKPSGLFLVSPVGFSPEILVTVDGQQYCVVQAHRLWISDRPLCMSHEKHNKFIVSAFL